MKFAGFLWIFNQRGWNKHCTLIVKAEDLLFVQPSLNHPVPLYLFHFFFPFIFLLWYFIILIWILVLYLTELAQYSAISTLYHVFITLPNEMLYCIRMILTSYLVWRGLTKAMPTVQIINVWQIRFLYYKSYSPLPCHVNWHTIISA